MNAFTEYADDIVILDEDEAPDPDSRPGQKYAWIYAKINKMKQGQFMFVPDSDRAHHGQLLPSLRSKQARLQILVRKRQDDDGRMGVGVWKLRQEQARKER